jgi:hypothetical protein
VKVQIQKRADGAGVLRCIRDDGSVAWQKQTERHAHFYALHDLTHFTVETVLGFERGFFGLIAGGWEMDDTTGKGSRGPIPQEAGAVEVIVGMLDGERASGRIWTIEEFHEFGGPALRTLTETDLAALRRRRSELFTQWAEVPPGGMLELTYPSKAAPAEASPR